MMLTGVIVQPVVALVAGFLVLLMPRLLNVIVAIYLIVVGMIGIWPHIGLNDSWPTLH